MNPGPLRTGTFASGAIAVTDAFTTLLSLVLSGRAYLLNFEVSNAGAGALNGFKIQLQDHPDGEFYDFLSGTDFDSATNPNMRFASTSGPHELASAGKTHVHARIGSAYAVRLQAKSASTSTVTVVGTSGPG